MRQGKRKPLLSQAQHERKGEAEGWSPAPQWKKHEFPVEISRISPLPHVECGHLKLHCAILASGCVPCPGGRTISPTSIHLKSCFISNITLQQETPCFLLTPLTPLPYYLWWPYRCFWQWKHQYLHYCNRGLLK